MFGLLRRGGKVYTKVIADASSATLYPDSNDGIDADMSAALIDSIVDQEADVSVCRQRQTTTTHRCPPHPPPTQA